MSKKLVSVDTGNANFGIVFENNRAVRVPPIARWAKGKKLAKVKAYFHSKRAVIKTMELKD